MLKLDEMNKGLNEVVSVEVFEGKEVEFLKINEKISFVSMQELGIQHDFDMADSMYEDSSYISQLNSEHAFTNRVYSDLVGTYRILVSSRNLYDEFIELVELKQRNIRFKYSKQINEIQNDFFNLTDAKRNNQNIRKKYSDRIREIEHKKNNDKDLFFNVTYEEWKNNRMSDNAKLTKLLAKRFNGSLLEFYNATNRDNTESIYYFTISDRVQHISGMSYYSTGEWQGMGGSSCQDPKNDDVNVMKLGGALHDNTLYVGFVHEHLEDLEDLEGKMLARTCMRLIFRHNDYLKPLGSFEKNIMISTKYYHESTGIIENALLELEKARIGILSNNVFDDSDITIRQSANGFYEFIRYEEIYVNETIDDYVSCECPLCDGTKTYSTSYNYEDIVITCPACEGSGKVEAWVNIEIDDYIEAEIVRDVLPYAEYYYHFGHEIKLSINREYLLKYTR